MRLCPPGFSYHGKARLYRERGGRGVSSIMWASDLQRGPADKCVACKIHRAGPERERDKADAKRRAISKIQTLATAGRESNVI